MTKKIFIHACFFLGFAVAGMAMAWSLLGWKCAIMISFLMSSMYFRLTTFYHLAQYEKDNRPYTQALSVHDMSAYDKGEEFPKP